MAAKGKRGGRIIILVALILILAVGGVYVWLQMQQQETAQPLPTPEPKRMVNIVITTQLIPRGVEITEAAVMTVEYPEENLVQGTFITDIQSVIGSRARYDLEPGVPLTRAVLIQPTGGSVASFDVPRDFVAIPIQLDRVTTIADALAAGDHVMVVGCMLLVDIDADFQSILPNSVGVVIAPGPGGEEGGPTTASAGIEPGVQGRAELDPTLNQPLYIQPSEPQRPRMVCQTVIQDAVVLRVGEFVDAQAAAATAAAAQQQQAQDQQQQQPAPAPTQTPKEKLITLVVSPQDAVLLNYMILSEININLALRNPSDTRPIVTDAVTQQYLMDQKNIPLPAKLPYALEPATRNFNSTNSDSAGSAPE